MRSIVLITLLAAQAGADERAEEARRSRPISIVPGGTPQHDDPETFDPGRTLRITGAVLMLSSTASMAGAIYSMRRAKDLNEEYWRLGGIYAPDYASMDRAHAVNQEAHRATLLTWACGALTAALLGSGAIVYSMGARYQSAPALAVHPRGVSLAVKF